MFLERLMVQFLQITSYSMAFSSKEKNRSFLSAVRI